MSIPAAASLDAVPQEVLEQVAFFLGTDTFLGPPSALVPLLSTNNRIHSSLSITYNCHLYARIFAHKFDLSPAIRRLGSHRITPLALSEELRRRCFYLKRIRSRVDSIVIQYSMTRDEEQERDECLHAILWTAYLMMLENDGKNRQQLRDYARIGEWLRDYWFDDRGASLANISMKSDRWPANTEQTSLAMWLFWFLLDIDEYARKDEFTRNAGNVLKIFSLAAHQYNLASPSWINFIPPPRSGRANSVVIHYSEKLALCPAPLAAPAILSFLTLVNKISTFTESASFANAFTSSMGGSLSTISDSQEWDCEWGRCVNLGQPNYNRILVDAFIPGSIEGIWEGMFTYTEFTAYAALLSGAPPPILQKSLVVRHRQTWKLREHHLYDSGIEANSHNINGDLPPLSPGDPLRSYFPLGTHIKEHADGLEIWEPGQGQPNSAYHYKRATHLSCSGDKDESEVEDKPRVRDIIVTGEGHSAWGQFNLIGRVRPCDGFISLSKEYVDGDRGKWLYRGYLVGNVHGIFAGRWRDTLSPAEVPGYEGCFTMSRRR